MRKIVVTVNCGQPIHRYHLIFNQLPTHATFCKLYSFWLPEFNRVRLKSLFLREYLLNMVANKLIQYLHEVIEKYFVCVSRNFVSICLHRYNRGNLLSSIIQNYFTFSFSDIIYVLIPQELYTFIILLYCIKRSQIIVIHSHI